MIRRGLKGIDFYKNVPAQYKQGTVAGAFISIFSITVLVILSLSAISSYMTPTKINDLIIDEKHSEDSLKVNLDIQFPNTPCALLSLDIENTLRNHQTNIKGNVKKIILPGDQQYHDDGVQFDQKVKRIKTQMLEKKGCRMVGTFEIDRVPGNFHFSNHAYGQQTIAATSPHLPRLDLTHKINYLYFGQASPQEYIQNSLGKFRSEKEIEDGFLGISYIYFLEIISKNVINSNGYHRESFFYTVRINEVLLGAVPMVFFKYETNPMTELEIGQYMSFPNFIIELVAIIGGIYTVASIVDKIVHSSLHYLIKKHQMGKLI